MQAGAIALVGSGEYLPVMAEVDRQLLATVGGASAHVVVLPTAAGLEQPSSPRRWADMGIRHFTGLGAKTEAALILRREDAFDSRWLSLLEQADLIYFSGGSPRHLVDTLQDSPAWEVVRARHAAGAVLAGCSAGAMAFGRVTLSPRRLWGAGALPPEAETWYPALGLVPHLVVLPHFDRWRSRMSESLLRQMAASLPANVNLVGVDEDTALITHDGHVWQVQGRQGVSIIDAERGLQRYEVGVSAPVLVGVSAKPPRG